MMTEFESKVIDLLKQILEKLKERK